MPTLEISSKSSDPSPVYFTEKKIQNHHRNDIGICVCISMMHMMSRCWFRNKHLHIKRLLNLTILQLTDLHLGEAARLDTLTLSLMRSIFQQEKPDLVVFSGDLISGYAIWSEQERINLWKRALSICEEFHVPFATLFGNHDDQPL